MARLQTRDVPLISAAEAVIRGERERARARARERETKESQREGVSKREKRSSAGILSAR